MSAQLVVEVLDEVGGWVHPDELAYQLRARGSRVNERTIARLCREGRVKIDPAGYTLTEAEREARTPAPPPPLPDNRRPACELVLRTMHDSPATWWRPAKMADLVGRHPATVQRAMVILHEVGLLEFREGTPIRPGRRPHEYALKERVEDPVTA